MPYKDLEKRRARDKQRYDADRGAAVARTQEYQRNHPGCVRSAELLRKYGITAMQYADLLAAQGGVCAICGGSNTRKGALIVDHDHETGVVRGLLCHSCNVALGLLKDCPAVIHKAAAYLEVHRGSAVRPNSRRVEAAPAVGNLAVHPAGGPGDQATPQRQDWHPGIFN